MMRPPASSISAWRSPLGVRFALAAKGVRADHLGEAVGVVGRGHLGGAHLEKVHLDAQVRGGQGRVASPPSPRR